MQESNAITDNIKNYYGKVLETNRDLKTNACCTADAIPLHLKDKLARINGEILDKFYGCGSPIPSELKGRTVVDLGCGSGRDVYLVSQLVGEAGRVVGVDMTREQLDVAERHLDEQMKVFGYSKPNVSFVHGQIEDLSAIDSDSVDVVISNCVINLSPHKEKVFSEIFRVLKPGGELYFSDVFSGRRLPEPLSGHSLLQAECLAGAMYIEDFRRMLRGVGCLDYRTVSTSTIEVQDGELEALVKPVDFYSITVRAFKIAELEDICEDYGQVAVYRGSLENEPHQFVLDDHHVFETGRGVPVCGNTASMLSQSRFAQHFTLHGDRSTHFGPFDCGPQQTGLKSKANSGNAPSSGACC